MRLQPENLFQHETNLLVVPAGQTLFAEGEQGEFMYVLMSGTAEILVNGRLVEEAAPGALLGEMTLVDASPRSATVVARTECKFVTVDAHRFNFLIQETPNFATHVMRVIAERLRRTDCLL
ncbi:MAG: cyclic nucleotide-binding domain-containing protein [Burkholderiales bacterium]|nr:cyclic nucleotide-binding domain-containing protein [Sulfuricellaceae bacterium]